MSAVPRAPLKDRKSTLHDVAQRAGVSRQTVSRVVNHHPSVARATRSRVLRAIEELDYLPNRAAQSLASRRSRSIGILSLGTRYYGPAQMLAHIEAGLKARGYGLVYAAVEDEGLDAIGKQIATLRSQLIDGLVLITPVDTVPLPDVRALLGLPYVMVDVMLGEQVPSVVINQVHGAHLAAGHLLDLGHRRICEITGPLAWFGARERHEGVTAALARAPVEPHGVAHGDWTAASGYRAARRLLHDTPGFTGLVVGNDQMALGALRALREAGLRVPQDVSVVGFDDQPEAAYFEPPLTTVRQDFEALGQQATQLLMSFLDAPEAPAQQRVLYPSLVVRRSTAAPRPD